MFGRKLTDYEPVKEALIAYVTRAGEKLRRERLLARHMQIFLHNSPFATAEPYYGDAAGFRLPHPTSDTRRADRPRHRRPAAHLTAPASATASAASCWPS